MPIERKDWGPPVSAFGGRETPGYAPTESLSGSVAVPTPAAGEGKSAVPENAVAEDTDNSVLHRKLIAEGIFTPEELGRYYELSSDEVGALSKPPATRRSIDKELADIADVRRRDRRAYFKDEAIQKRERDLLEIREQLKAGSKSLPAKSKPVEGDGAALDPELRAEWEAGPGIAHALKVARSAASTVLDGLEEDERTGFQEGFDRLPSTAQTQVFRFLAIEPGGSWRPASDEALQDFQLTEEGAELVKEWGRKAAHNVGVVRGRMDLMLRSMTPADRGKVEAWFDALSSSQAKAVLKSLAGQ